MIEVLLYNDTSKPLNTVFLIRTHQGGVKLKQICLGYILPHVLIN